MKAVISRIGQSALTVAAATALITAAVSGAGAADRILKMIDKQKPNTAVGFTGGYGNVIGFHKFDATRYSIFYSDAVKSSPSKHAYTVLRNGDTTWTFSWTGAGAFEKAEDQAGNVITFTYPSSGTIAYVVTTAQGFTFASVNGTVVKPDSRARDAQFASLLAATDPSIVVPVKVNACQSWPAKPGAVTVSYNYGQGAETRTIESSSRSGRVFNYNHVIRPFDGLRTIPTAKRLVTTGFPKGTVSACDIQAQLAAVCAKVKGDFKTACLSARDAIAPHCKNSSFGKLAVKAVGVTRAQIKSALPAGLTVTAIANYTDNFGQPKQVKKSAAYTFNAAGPTIELTLPCWNVWQDDFAKTGTFSAHGGLCSAPVQVGRSIAFTEPSSFAAESGLRFDRFVKLIQKGCFKGTYESEYKFNLETTVTGNTIKGVGTQPKPFEETYTFDLVRNLNDTITGTYTFTMKHPAKPGPFHTGTVVVPLKLEKVVAP